MHFAKARIRVRCAALSLGGGPPDPGRSERHSRIAALNAGPSTVTPLTVTPELPGSTEI